jgi:hypothetical protein
MTEAFAAIRHGTDARAVRVKLTKYGTSLEVTLNGYQFTTITSDHDMMELIHDTLTDYLRHARKQGLVRRRK